MLNRLFIVIGILAIIAIGAGFIGPLFVDWNAYRSRLETIVESALGTDVRIGGNISVTLLPQPVVRLTDISVGPEEARDGHVEAVEIEFSLVDFLRDRYAVTRLSLVEPTVWLLIDEEGQFVSSLNVPDRVIASNVSVEDAEIVNGTIALEDRRSGMRRTARQFDGRLQFADLRGPFSVQGTLEFERQNYDVRLNTSDLNPENAMTVAAFVRPVTGAFSAGVEGLLQAGAQLRFEGSLTYRQTAAASAALDGGGDLLLTANMEADSGQVLLSDYTLVPDENRAAMRLTGAAAIKLGADASFDAVVSGGVVSLAPRDATREGAQESYELARLLAELPAPPIPPMPGRIGLDLAELDLRAFALREVRLDARSDGEKWTIGTLTGRMPGDSAVSLVGELRAEAGGPAFTGSMTMDSARLDALALQWRRGDPDNNPLFNMPGSLAGRVTYDGDAVALEDARFMLDGIENRVNVRFGYGDGGGLTLNAELGTFDTLHSDALRALLPDFAEAGFAETVRSGVFDIAAEEMQLFDLPAEGIAVAGSWDASRLGFDQLDITDIGGARLDLSGVVLDPRTAPRFAGKGQISLGRGAQDGIVARVLDMAGREALTDRVAALLVPSELAVELTEPGTSGEQRLSLAGRAGAADADVALYLSAGLASAMTAPLVLEAELSAADPGALGAQLGLGDAALLPPDAPAMVAITAEGAVANSLETDITVEGGGDRLHFHGNTIFSRPDRPTGKGKLDFSVSDAGAFARLAGAEGIGYGPASGTADLAFAGGESLGLSNIDARSRDILISGGLTRNREGSETVFAGELRLSALTPDMAAGLLGGPTTLISQAEVWPDGPFELGENARNSRGRISIAAPFVRHAGRDIAGDTRFDLVWDEQNTRLRGLTAALGDGQLEAEATLCCYGVTADHQATGRVTLSGVGMDSILPEVPARVLDGIVDGGFTFSGTGDSVAAILGSLTGEGSFNISEFGVAAFDPGAFERVAAIDNIVDLEEAELRRIVEEALREGPFRAEQTAGVFSVAGGMLRIANQAAEGETGRLFGGMSLAFDTLALDGKWTLTPVAPAGADSTSQVTALIGGTLIAPTFALDLGPMIDAIKVRAYELEVERLEKLRAEQEARARAAAEERARLMEEQARQRAIEEAREAAEEAERLRQEQRQKALDELIRQLGDSRDPLVNNGDGGTETPATEGEEAPLDLMPDSLDPSFVAPQSDLF